ncbi:MAG: YIP1 family protein [bacterium]
MDNVTGMDAQKKSPVQGIIDMVKQVILNPAEFYRGMPKVGGFGDPLVFAVVLGVVTGIVQAILGLVHLSPVGLSAIIIMPIGVLIGGFIGAAIVFVIWKLMGSSESYETAYRCGAYAMAVQPILAVAGLIPVVGSLVGLAWMTFLLVQASVEVHKIPAKKAWLVFGIIAAVFALMTLGAQAGARKAQRSMADFQKEMGVSTGGKDMTPEQAGKAAAAFMKAMQEQAAKQAQEEKAKAE